MSSDFYDSAEIPEDFRSKQIELYLCERRTRRTTCENNSTKESRNDLTDKSVCESLLKLCDFINFHVGSELFEKCLLISQHISGR